MRQTRLLRFRRPVIAQALAIFLRALDPVLAQSRITFTLPFAAAILVGAYVGIGSALLSPVLSRFDAAFVRVPQRFDLTVAEVFG